MDSKKPSSNYCSLPPAIISREVQKEIRQIETLINYLSKKKNRVPAGNLRVNYRKGKPQYYLVSEKGDTQGKYIPKADLRIAKAIAQRDYEQNLLSLAKQRLSTLKSIKTGLLSVHPKNYHEELTTRKSLIAPYEQSDNEFLKDWEALSFPSTNPIEITSNLFTEKGEQVRSKSEREIANKLSRMNIPYKYEYPLYLPTLGTIYPDFTILNIYTREPVILEHFGMMDNPEYAEKAVRKLQAYHSAGFFEGKNLIITMECSEVPFDSRMLDTILERFTHDN